MSYPSGEQDMDEELCLEQLLDIEGFIDDDLSVDGARLLDDDSILGLGEDGAVPTKAPPVLPAKPSTAVTVTSTSNSRLHSSRFQATTINASPSSTINTLRHHLVTPHGGSKGNPRKEKGRPLTAGKADVKVEGGTRKIINLRSKTSANRYIPETLPEVELPLLAWQPDKGKVQSKGGTRSYGRYFTAPSLLLEQPPPPKRARQAHDLRGLITGNRLNQTAQSEHTVLSKQERQQAVHSHEEGLLSGHERVHSGQQRVHSGQEGLLPGQEMVHSGQQRVHSGQEKLQSGQEMVHSGQGWVHSGQGQIHSGQERVHSGQGQIHSGQGRIHSVQGRVHSGQERVYSGQERVYFQTVPSNQQRVVRSVDGEGAAACKEKDFTFGVKALNRTSKFVRSLDAEIHGSSAPNTKVSNSRLGHSDRIGSGWRGRKIIQEPANPQLEMEQYRYTRPHELHVYEGSTPRSEGEDGSVNWWGEGKKPREGWTGAFPPHRAAGLTDGQSDSPTTNATASATNLRRPIFFMPPTSTPYTEPHVNHSIDAAHRESAGGSWANASSANTTVSFNVFSSHSQSNRSANGGTSSQSNRSANGGTSSQSNWSANGSTSNRFAAASCRLSEPISAGPFPYPPQPRHSVSVSSQPRHSVSVSSQPTSPVSSTVSVPQVASMATSHGGSSIFRASSPILSLPHQSPRSEGSIFAQRPGILPLSSTHNFSLHHLRGGEGLKPSFPLDHL